jgi:16S rRNA (guanine527-N7)-methyltransferase
MSLILIPILEDSLKEYFPTEVDEILSLFDNSKISLFYFFLRKENERGGFFSKADSESIWERHVLESLYHVYRITKILNVSRETKILDVGTGPGLPGFLFSCLKEPPSLSLLDSQKRRLFLLESFLKTSLEKKVDTPKFFYSRVEEHKAKYDLVVMRSAIPYPWSIEMISHLVCLNGYFVPFFGKLKFQKEFEADYMKNFGFTVTDEVKLSELEFLGERNVKFLKKIRLSNHCLRRDWSTIQKEIRKFNG